MRRSWQNAFHELHNILIKTQYNWKDGYRCCILSFLAIRYALFHCSCFLFCLKLYHITAGCARHRFRSHESRAKAAAHRTSPGLGVNSWIISFRLSSLIHHVPQMLPHINEMTRQRLFLLSSKYRLLLCSQPNRKHTHSLTHTQTRSIKCGIN